MLFFLLLELASAGILSTDGKLCTGSCGSSLGTSYNWCYNSNSDFRYSTYSYITLSYYYWDYCTPSSSTTTAQISSPFTSSSPAPVIVATSVTVSPVIVATAAPASPSSKLQESVGVSPVIVATSAPASPSSKLQESVGVKGGVNYPLTYLLALFWFLF